ncbi:acyl-homoserine-lactone synthase AbaI, partial [Acinetobacter baumannii]
QEAINFAREQGAKQLITTSPLGVERLLRAAGFRAHRAGPPMTIDGYSMFACLIDI